MELRNWFVEFHYSFIIELGTIKFHNYNHRAPSFEL